MYAPLYCQARYVARRIIKLGDNLVAEPSLYVSVLFPCRVLKHLNEITCRHVPKILQETTKHVPSQMST